MAKLKLNLTANGTKHRRPYARIYDMGQDKVSQIDAMLMKGDKPLQVATYMQQNWNLHLDINLMTLEKMVLRYKNDIISAQIAKTELAAAGQTGIAKRVQDFKGKIIAEETLCRIVLLQQTRVDKLYDVESKMPSMVMNQLTKELTLFKDMLNQLSGLQMDLGILQRVPKKIKADLKFLTEAGRKERELVLVHDSDRNKNIAAAYAAYGILAGDIVDGEYTEVSDEG